MSRVGHQVAPWRVGKGDRPWELIFPELTLGQTSFDDMCRRDRPEAIFLPHRNYRSLNEVIARSDCIGDYERVYADSSSPLYVRRDLVPQYRCKDAESNR